MSILLSVNPPYAGWLVDGKKTIEWRKNPLPKGRAFIYETKKGGGCAMVIGECEIVGASTFNPKRIPDDILKGGWADRDFILRYAGAGAIVANFCINSKRYDKPIPLSEFRYRCPDPKNCWLCKYSMVDETYPGRYDLVCHAGIDRPPQSWCYAMFRLKGVAE